MDVWHGHGFAQHTFFCRDQSKYQRKKQDLSEMSKPTECVGIDQ
jgi:hypothetical protein